MALKDWSTTAGDNNDPAPDGFPEGMAPSGVNNAAREVMAQVRGWYEDPAWINFGYTYAYVGATQFRVSGLDVTAKYPVGRRVRAVGTTTGTIYGTITVSAFATDTTITVSWDSGSLASETLQISAGLPSLGKPIPYSTLGLTGQIALADLVTAAEATIMGRASGAGTGTRTDLTAAQVKTILAIAEADITLADNTTNDASTARHGFLKKLSNVATEFMNGQGNWATVSSKLVQRRYATYTANASLTTALPIDDTIPQSTEGASFISDSITGTASNIIRATVMGSMSSASAQNAVAMFKAAGDAFQAIGFSANSTATGQNFCLIGEFTASGSAQTVDCRIGNNAGSAVRLNGTTTARQFGGTQAAILILEEMTP